MELLQLRYFCSAAVTQNFSKTAEQFLVPQSAVSQSIKRLETELGIPLFVRRANKVELNEYGITLFQHVSRGIGEIETGIKKLSEKNDELTGTISLLIRTNRRYVTDCIAQFKKRYPKTEFILHHECTNYDLKNFDIIIDEQPPAYGEFERRLLVTEPIKVGVSQEHRFSSRESVSLNELEHEHFISMPRDSSLYRNLDYLCSSAGIRPNITIFCDNPYYIRKYTSMNLGITLIPEFSWKGLEEDVIALPLQDVDVRRSTFLFSRNTPSQSRIVGVFQEFLLEGIQKERGLIS